MPAVKELKLENAELAVITRNHKLLLIESQMGKLTIPLLPGDGKTEDHLKEQYGITYKGSHYKDETFEYIYMKDLPVKKKYQILHLKAMEGTTFSKGTIMTIKGYVWLPIEDVKGLLDGTIMGVDQLATLTQTALRKHFDVATS